MNNQVEFFNIKGERCSGTSYLQKLIENNLGVPYKNNIGWKHGYCNLNMEELRSSIKSVTLFIFRDVFDWARSFYLKPHHMENTKHGAWTKWRCPSFLEFISREVRQLNFNHDGEMLIERHPFYLTYPKNLLELRKWKIEHFLAHENILPNTYYIKYEDLIKTPEVIVADINDRWFKREYEFKNWINYGDTSNVYTPTQYFNLSPRAISFIIKNVDWSLENQIGYSLPSEIISLGK